METNTQNTKGIIYIFTNESMPGLIKIGKTTNIKQRLQDLDTTGVPTPFKLHYAVEVDGYDQKEKLIHQGYAKDRVRPNREFFRIEPENATAILKALGGKEIDPNYIDISIDENGNIISTSEYDSSLLQAPITTFSMLQIPIGSALHFTRNENIICQVIDNRKVKYNENIYSLSQLTREILQRNYNWKSGFVNGFQFWKYEDEILTERRRRLETEFNIESELDTN